MSILSTEITTDPAGLGYGSWLPDSPGTVAALINAKTFTMPKTYMVSEIDVVGLYPDGPVAGDAVLAKLEAFAAAAQPLSNLVNRALKAVYQPQGLNIGSVQVQDMLTMLGTEGVLTTDESTKLKSIANQPASRADVLGIEQVSVEQVIGEI